MSDHELEIIQLVQRIQSLSTFGRDDDTVNRHRLAKIQELTNVLLPRLQAQYSE